jgi:arsenate reductase (thioredoxin)
VAAAQDLACRTIVTNKDWTPQAQNGISRKVNTRAIKRIGVQKWTLNFMIVTLSLGCQAANATEANILQTLRPLVAQVVKEFDQIPQDRQTELKEIALYVKARIAAHEPVQMTFICTHNSRRSHLAQVWAQTAAAYYDVPGVRTYSGGLEATACNPRTVQAFRRAGFSVVGSGVEKNPVYLIQYSDNAEPLRAFSKVYNQDPNPKENYLAIMTCSHADKNCPLAQGSSKRVAIPYDDPKDSDGKPEEEATYDARCKQIAREMFYLMSQVKA